MKLLHDIQHLLTNTLLRIDDLATKGRLSRRLRRAYRLMYYTLRGMNHHRTAIESAALTLYTTFALVPLLALMLILLSHLGVLDPLIDSLYATFSEWSVLLDKVLATAADAASKVPNGILAVIGIFTLVGALFTVFSRVEQSFNHIWGIRRRRGIVRRYVAYLIIALTVPTLWGFATSFAHNAFALIGLSHDVNAVLAALISVAVAALAATLLYKFLPYTPVAWRNALRAGITAGLLLALWQWGYVHVQGFMNSYNVIYGSFAAIPFFIIWLQTSWRIVLFGCELCYVWQHSDRYEAIDRRRLSCPLRTEDGALSVVVVGSGNVAEAFARNIAHAEGLLLRQICARNPMRGQAIAALTNAEWCDSFAAVAPADIYIIAVSDTAVEDVAHRLSLPDDAVVVHTAGSVPLAALPERGGRRGIIYAFQTFTSGRAIDLRRVPLFVEADGDEARERIMHLATRLSSQVEYATSNRRRVIHLAGVMVNNFVNALYTAGGDVVEREGLSFEVLRPLILETAAKAVASSNPRAVQTGPAVRGDVEVCRRHEAMLNGEPELQHIYEILTQYIWETSKKI